MSRLYFPGVGYSFLCHILAIIPLLCSPLACYAFLGYKQLKKEVFQQLPIMALIERKIQFASFSLTYLLATVEVYVCLLSVCVLWFFSE